MILVVYVPRPCDFYQVEFLFFLQIIFGVQKVLKKGLKKDLKKGLKKGLNLLK